MAILINCSNDSTENNFSEDQTTPSLSVSTQTLTFSDTEILMFSEPKTLTFSGLDLSDVLVINTGFNFEISLDAQNFESEITIQTVNNQISSQILYVRFAPSENAIGQISESLIFTSTNANSQSVNLIANGIGTNPNLNVNYSELFFDDTIVGGISESIPIEITASNLTSFLNISSGGQFLISLDEISYNSTLQIDQQTANEDFLLYVRFEPSEIGESSNLLEFTSEELTPVSVELVGTGIPLVYNYQAFNETRLAYGGGFSQSSTQTFTLHDDTTNIESVIMYLQLDCPSGGCNEWDVYSNILVRDLSTNNWYEIGRYITPYGVGTNQLERGLEIDVTDFKSLLKGNVELKAFIEVWGSDGWKLSVDFDYIEGTPDYQYYFLDNFKIKSGDSNLRLEISI